MCRTPNDGVEATCNDRITWVQQHVTMNEPHPCASAVQQVLADCPTDCGFCTLTGAGCAMHENMYVKKFEEEETDIVQQVGSSSQLSKMSVAACGLLSLTLIAAVAGVSLRRRRTLRPPVEQEELFAEEAVLAVEE